MDYLVSIIVPVYNVEKYISDCLESIIKQSYRNIEIILINDGSTDSSLKICEEYRKIDHRIVLVNKQNEGLSTSRQMGLELSNGIYFITVDSDDILDSNYVEKMVATIGRNDADIALCAICEFDTDGNYHEVLLDKKLSDVYAVSRSDLEKNYYRTVEDYKMSDSWNKIYRLEFLKASGVKFELKKEYNGTDLLFNYSLLMHKPRIALINEPLYHYRITPNSRVRRKDKHLERGFKVILDTLLEENQRTINSVAMERQIYATYLSMLKYATLDYYEEHKGNPRCDLLKGFYRICNFMPELTYAEKADVQKIVGRNLKVFAKLLLDKNAIGIYIYYKVRDLLKFIKMVACDAI